MDYVELDIPVADPVQAEILVAYLADYPFESFMQENSVLKAYIPGERLADCKEQVDALIAESGVEGARYISIGKQDWNALWESNFTPVDVDGRVCIRAPFHHEAPDGVLEVVVMPKMSFGTGHHATTCLMISLMMDLVLTGRQGIDMGSGTGVLAIVAVKRGADSVVAVDIDEWACDNCRENIRLNGVEDRIEPLLGDASCIAGRSCDLLMANINRNILIADMPSYAAALRPGGDLLMSGFLEADIPIIRAAAEKAGLCFLGSRLRDGWAAVHCRKQAE